MNMIPRRAAVVVWLCLLLAVSALAQEPGGNMAPPAFVATVEGKGPPMILIPGLTCSGDVWRPTVEHFRDRYECHVLTLAGFAGRPAITAPFLETVRKELAAYIRAKKLDKPVVVGHSLGGFMVFWLGALEPDLVGPLIAVDGVPFFSALRDPAVTAEAAKPQAEQMKAMMSVPQNAAMREANQRRWLVTMIADPKALEMAVKWGIDSDPAAVAQAMYELMTTDARGEVKKISAPVLLLGALGGIPAMELPAAKSRYEKQVESVPHCTVHFSEKVKHFIMFDDAEWMWKEMDAFLGGVAKEGKKE